MVWYSIVLATMLALSTHIYMMKFCFYLNNLLNPSIPLHCPQYSSFITCSAYLTAIFPTTVLAIAFYFGGVLLPFGKNTNALILCALVLGIKGELLRMPLMNFVCNIESGFSSAILYSFFNHFHIWVANLVLSFCIVYICPKKSDSEEVAKLTPKR